MSRVLLDDFEPMLRLGLEELLAEAGHEVVGDEPAATSLLDRAQAAAADIVIVDAQRPTAPETLRALTRSCPASVIISCSSKTAVMRVYPRHHHGESYACAFSPEALAGVAQDG